MFEIGAATRIYLATGATDMRKGFTGLECLIRELLECDPFTGHLFLFSNSRRDRLKVVYFDGSGLWVCSKRLERGRLCWPSRKENKVQLSCEQFALLIGGIDLRETRERKWYRRHVGEEPTEIGNSA
jgi:transposase